MDLALSLYGGLSIPSATTTPTRWAYLINEAGGNITELTMAVTEKKSTIKNNVPIEPVISYLA